MLWRCRCYITFYHQVVSSLARHGEDATGTRDKTIRPEFYIKLSDLSDMKIVGSLSLKAVIAEISRKNLQTAVRKMPAGLSRNNIIWTLPSLVFEKDLGLLKKQLDTLLRQGFRNFQVSNLSHLAMLKGGRGSRGLNIFSSYELNILNSQAMEAMAELGVSCCHFSIETDIENMGKALLRSRRKTIFTVFGFIPLFTSRLRHRLYDSKLPVMSTRQEEYIWQARGPAGYLFSKSPFSAFGCKDQLLAAGIHRWIIDLSRFPSKRKLPRRLPSNLSKLASRFRGRSFNLVKNLE